MLELDLLGFWTPVALVVLPCARIPLTLGNLLFFALTTTLLTPLMAGLVVPLASLNSMFARFLLALAVAVVILVPVYMLRGSHRTSKVSPDQPGLTPES